MTFLKRMARSLLRIIAATTLVTVIGLLLFQSKMIYHPRPYKTGAAEREPRLIALTYNTSQGAQRCFYLPPREQPLRRLWICFAGNGSLALDWLYIAKDAPDPRDGFLMIDYPGYGDCRGAPSPGTIEESSEAAFSALARQLHTQPAALDAHVSLLCLSLGCAAGLNFAAHHPVDHIILLAPFTTMRDMARRAVGWPLCYLLLHNFDNGARLGELAARAHPPEVTILHGDADTFIPIAMSRKLAAAYPAIIHLEAVAGAGHNTIVSSSRPRLLELLGR